MRGRSRGVCGGRGHALTGRLIFRKIRFRRFFPVFIKKWLQFYSYEKDLNNLQKAFGHVSRVKLRIREKWWPIVIVVWCTFLVVVQLINIPIWAKISCITMYKTACLFLLPLLGTYLAILECHYHEDHSLLSRSCRAVGRVQGLYNKLQFIQVDFGQCPC